MAYIKIDIINFNVRNLYIPLFVSLSYNFKWIFISFLLPSLVKEGKQEFMSQQSKC